MEFKSHLVKAEEQLGHGHVSPGKVVWEPLDDAAKASPQAEAALAAGIWKPKNPNEIEEAKARLAAAEQKERNRRGE